MQTRIHAIILALLWLSTASLLAVKNRDPVDTTLTKLENRYHVQIHHQYDPQTFFPRAWMSPSLELHAEQIHPEDVKALAPALKQFLETHPAPVVRKNLDHIYLLGKLSFQGREYGSTHSDKSIYIVWDRSRKCTLPFILERLHSEFSSTLSDHHAFPAERWLQINPPHFRYTGTGFEMLGDSRIYESNAQDWADGFLYKYSRSSMENDFNMISAWLFTKPDALEKVASQSLRIQRKILLAEEFYRSISDQYAFR